MRNIVFLTLFVLIAAVSALAREPLTVGSAVAQPGQRVSGWIDIPAASDPGTKIPVSIAHGSADGPVLALVAGTHGYEYTSIIALQRLLPRLDPSRMRGSVILVHMANPPTFYGRRIYYGPDGKNLNRMYPGDANGSISERIAHAITTQVIDKATHLVDMHCGDGNESLRPYAYWDLTGNAAVDAQTREMALAYGLGHVVVGRDMPKDPAKSVYTTNTALTRGKPAITVESGGMGLTDEASVAAQEAGALSVARQLGIQSDAPSVRTEKVTWYDRSEVLRAPVDGVWYPAVEKTQMVAAGALVGTLRDPFGATLAEIRAPFAGEMLYVVATPPAGKGEPLGMVAQVAAGEPGR